MSNFYSEAAAQISEDWKGTVLIYPNRSEPPSKHEAASLCAIATKVAALKGYAFAGVYDAGAVYAGKVYFLPSGTITEPETARRLAIASVDDFFGGVVPHPFVSTKAISHPLVDNRAAAPRGWSQAFAERVNDVTLSGFSAFSLRDAQRCGQIVLECGPARVKPANGTGGRGQTVVKNFAQLARAIKDLGEEINLHGVVIEQNLDRVTTLSVGQVRIAGILASYYGKQRLTKDHKNLSVYGGSDLFVVRGGYQELLGFAPSLKVRVAIMQAAAYDRCADEFPGLLASRRNYDVVQGLDHRLRPCSGVLEQSWRVGGASPAEVAACEAFRRNPELEYVRSSCYEVYGEHEPPANASVDFRGVDDRVGTITKYTVLDTDADRT